MRILPGYERGAAKAGAIAGGDRLPWVAARDNFAPLANLGWQLHGYGELDPDLALTAAALSLPVRAFRSGADTRDAGLAPGAAYRDRPDGHVGLAMALSDTNRLRAYVQRHALSQRFAPPAVEPAEERPMTEQTIPRDPHADNALIDEMVTEGGAQSGRQGGRVAAEIASRDEERGALGADPEPTRATGADKVQPNIPTRADNEGAQGGDDRG